MAANFHESSQCRKWLMVRRELEERRSADFRYLSTKEYIKLNVYYGSVMQAIAKRLQLRQIVVASAQVYFKRFYTRNSFRILDPLLLCATCIYVGSKIEESPQHIKNVATEAKNVANEMKISGGFPFDPSNIAECEFYLLEDLDFYMILYHAYRPLTS
ncbi:cyclin-like protein [Cladochytrium replicatum]|nr:cyclin-like protein [Cladochytrium replicatum]